jgi:guanylate kinase
MLDMASLLFNKFSKNNEKYSNEYVTKLCKTIDQINEDAEQESVEIELMGNEDIRLKYPHAYIIYERAITFEEAMSWGNCVCENECTC